MSIENTQVIYLDADDDIASILDRLSWAGQARVLLVFPPDKCPVDGQLDLVRLQRFANSQRLEVGLVLRDSRTSNIARQVGIPTFTAVEKGLRRRSWWRRRSRQPSRPRIFQREDAQEVRRRTRPSPLWRRWMWRYGATLLFFLTLGIVYISVVYAVPTATITLYPDIESVSVTRQIVADPQLESVNFSGASVPARRLVVIEEWQAGVETTGVIEVPDAPASGTVVFVNRREEAIHVPAGTRVTTTSGNRIAFQTLDEVEVPGAVGATAEATVVAIQPGAGGNVAAESINRVEGGLVLSLEVRNLEPTSGGGNRVSRSVTEADQARLRAQVLQQLQALALADMQAQLGENEFLARESLRVVNINQETYSHFVGEQADRMVLEIQAELQATAIDETQSIGLVYEELSQAIQPGFVLVPESFRFASGDVLGVDGQGRVSFEMHGDGVMAAELALDQPLEVISGQPKDIALAYLDEQLPLRTYPAVRISPGWLDRMPFLPVRIRVNIVDTTG